MTWSLETSNGHESVKIKYAIAPYTRGTVLELGCGTEKAYPHFIGVDNGHHFGRGAADIMVDTCEKLSLFADGSVDAVFSSHLLEHIDDYKATLTEWWRIIKVGGHLCLYLPHKDLYPNIGQEGANPDHKHDFLPGDITKALKDHSWELLHNETREQDNEYSFFQVYRKLENGSPSRTVKRPDKSVLVCRFGGCGDMLQTASIFPQLKAQGYSVTVMTTPRGQEVIKHDEFVDDWLILDTDQVPNQELFQFWADWSARFDKFINLSESVEASALAYPGRAQYAWPDELRREYYGRIHYLSLYHKIAGLPYEPHVHFFPTKEERNWAESEKSKHEKLIVWSLSGSSHHKAYPWTDSVLARLLLETDYTIALVGDDFCRLLEQGWEDEPRIIRTSGELSLRKTVALAQVADVVVGTETGVLNAVAYEANKKVILLSHSSVANLSVDWTNTVSLAPEHTPCYPCHKLHLSRQTCPEDEETGAAICAARIAPDHVFKAITS